MMRCSFFSIFIVILFFATQLAEGDSPWDGDGVTPECNGFHPPVNPKEAALVLITDHSLQQHKVSRVQYLYRAIACEFPPQVQVKIANVNDNGVAVWTHWMEGREVRQALHRNDTSGTAFISPCARISSIPRSALDAPRSNSTKPVPIHVLIVVDEEDFVKYPECDLRETFQQLAKSSPVTDPSLLHLDVIGVGKTLNVPALRVRIPHWEIIDTSNLKIDYAGEEQNMRSVFVFGHIMQQCAQLINLILMQDIKNDVVDVLPVEKTRRDLQNQIFVTMNTESGNETTTKWIGWTGPTPEYERQNDTTKDPADDVEARRLPKDVSDWMKDNWKYIMGLGIPLVVLCFLAIVLGVIGLFFYSSNRRTKENREKLSKTYGRSTQAPSESKLSASKRQEPSSRATYGEVESKCLILKRPLQLR